LSELNEGGVIVQEQLIVGSLEDLRRITEIDSTDVKTVEEFKEFLIENQITESLATAIDLNATDGPYSAPSISIGRAEYPQRTSYQFNAVVSPEFFERIQGSGYKVTGIRIYGKRKTLSGLFDFQYNLHLPIQEFRGNGNYALETRKKPDAWYMKGSDDSPNKIQVSSDFGAAGESLDPSILPVILKEAAQDLHDAIRIIKQHDRVTQGVGKIASSTTTQ
jgi:hypothetical protein